MAKKKKAAGKTARKRQSSGKSSTPKKSAKKRRRRPATSGESPPIAAIGASAGALEGFKKFFADMPADSGMAFVLVMHLDPTHESMMADLLARQTAMQVLQIEDGMTVDPNCVYIIPPNRYVELEGDKLRAVEPPERRGMRMPIDHFFRSMAREREARAISVVMTGTGADGSLGTQAVKAHGGLTLAQDPAQAAHDGMPRAAIATGCVDYILPTEKMPSVLCKYVQHPYVAAQTTDSEKIPEDTLSAIIKLVREHTKYDFSAYKKATVLRRIARRMGLNHIEAESDYLKFLHGNTDEVSALFRDLLIGVTAFFREPEAWKTLQKDVVPKLIEECEPDQAIRVWSTGCATGEEPYSVAMLLQEQVQGRVQIPEIQVFATDIDEEALEIARGGAYPESIAADLGADRLRRHFAKEGEHAYRVAKPIRESVVFAVQNLIGDPPFSKLDLIICRNLLIYLEQEVQEQIISLFHFALRPGGYLFLGHSESVAGHEDLFTAVSKKWRIYRRIGPARRDRIDFPIVADERFRSTPQAPTTTLRPSPLEHIAQQLLLKEFAPAAVLVNPKQEVLYFYGPTSLYLEMPTGEPSLSLLGMARDGLRTKLRAALYKAKQEQSQVSITARVKRNGSYQSVRVTVSAVKAPRDAEGLQLVAFEDIAVTAKNKSRSRSSEELEDTLVTQLEAELDATRDDLQSTIEELETSNEELKASNEEVMSMNEELQSTNEELETSKEELQSLNEELNTVNNQLSDKVQLLEATTNDLANLLSSTDTATIFLDTHLCIKRFTPAATKLFRLRESDQGRPLSDLSHDFTDGDLLADAKSVLRDLAPIGKEVQSAEEAWYLRRVLPYRTEDNRIDGVVVTFSDITQLKEVQEELRELNEELEHRIEERTGAIRLLYDVAASSNEADSIDQAVSYVLQRVCNYNGWDFGYVLFPAEDESNTLVVADMRFEAEEGRFAKFWEAAVGRKLPIENTIPGQVFVLAEAQWLSDVNDEWVEREMGIETVIDIGTVVAFPVMVEKRVVAVMEFFADAVFEPEEDLIKAMQSVGTQLGRIIERKNLEKQAALATLEEQRRIGRELHDSVLQQLAGASLLMESLLQDLNDDESPRNQDAARINESLHEMQDQLRAISHGLMPVEVDAGGLTSALKHLAEKITNRHNLTVQCIVDEDIQIQDDMTATNLYHIAQEAVHNAVKHADATHVILKLERDGNEVELSVSDNGTGMDVDDHTARGIGRRIMKYRAGVTGAVLELKSLENVGTTVTCTLTLSPLTIPHS